MRRITLVLATAITTFTSNERVRAVGFAPVERGAEGGSLTLSGYF